MTKKNDTSENNNAINYEPLLYTGRYYKIKDTVKTKVTHRKVKYCGIDKYKDEEHHNFFDEVTRLFHWIKETDVEPCI